jgi:hypothetical protein
MTYKRAATMIDGERAAKVWPLALISKGRVAAHNPTYSVTA